MQQQSISTQGIKRSCHYRLRVLFKLKLQTIRVSEARLSALEGLDVRVQARRGGVDSGRGEAVELDTLLRRRFLSSVVLCLTSRTCVDLLGLSSSKQVLEKMLQVSETNGKLVDVSNAAHESQARR